jgi:hypothetical protein
LDVHYFLPNMYRVVNNICLIFIKELDNLAKVRFVSVSRGLEFFCSNVLILNCSADCYYKNLPAFNRKNLNVNFHIHRTYLSRYNIMISS